MNVGFDQPLTVIGSSSFIHALCKSPKPLGYTELSKQSYRKKKNPLSELLVSIVRKYQVQESQPMCLLRDARKV